MRRVVIACLWLFIGATFVQAADQQRPDWIWQKGNRHVGRPTTCFLRTDIQCSRQPVRARLHCLQDFTHVTVYINGRHALSMQERDNQALPADVTRLLRVGKNHIAVRCRSIPGPSAVALVLELDDEAGKRFVYSNSEWRTSSVVGSGWRVAATNGWKRAVKISPVSKRRWNHALRSIEIDPFDDYTQWKQAVRGDKVSAGTAIQAPPGHKVDVLRQARPDEDSWVAMTFDPKGRLIVAKEKKGLLRLTLPGDQKEIRVEVINDSLRECRGLTFIGNDLFANANNDLTLYRLRDTNGDDRFDEVVPLKKSPGSVGHGRNDLFSAADGLLYSIHGDAVQVAQGATFAPPQHSADDPGDNRPNGHVVRTDAAGKVWRVMAKGLRNPYGIDFNSQGEMFTYDADAEHDMGAPWYRPTRIQHLVSGADYGWRRVTGTWPPYFPDHADSPPTLLTIGKGSPTSVKFIRGPSLSAGETLLVMDWAYGRIVAVHMTPRGASYAARAETFLRGLPLNVTDLGFSPDGTMYFITGGRQTQSALYRIRFPKREAEPAPTAQERLRLSYSAKLARTRRDLERRHRRDAGATDVALKHISHSDAWIRHAARVAIEHQPIEEWQGQWWTAKGARRIYISLALARVGTLEDHKELRGWLVEQANWKQLSIAEQQALVRILEINSRKIKTFDPEHAKHLSQELVALFSSHNQQLHTDAIRLASRLFSAQVVRPLFTGLKNCDQDEDLLLHLFALRNSVGRLTPAELDFYLDRLVQARQLPGGAGMPEFVRQVQTDALAALPAASRKRAEQVLAKREQEPAIPSIKRQFIRKWKLEDLKNLTTDAAKRDLKRGEKLFQQALCSSCHRFGPRGRYYGPDLSSVASRFSKQDILQSIVEPSRVVAEKYRNTLIQTTAGRIITGRVVLQRDYRSPSLQVSVDPLKPHQLVEIKKSEIAARRPSPLSPMPEGLLDTLTRDEILDLLAYLTSSRR